MQPESSGLQIHPLTQEGSELRYQISAISSEKQKEGGGPTHQLVDMSRFASVWDNIRASCSNLFA